jgi:uncharacterized membrane protein
MTSGLLFLTVFAAASVEMVEAVTIIVAVGVTRGWRQAWAGAATAVVLLSLAGAIGGISLLRLVPLDILRIGVGIIAVYMGVTWLKKAILRSVGRKAKHDEDAIYAQTVESIRKSGKGGFVVSCNGMLVEGTEVIAIVVSVGLAQHRLGLAAVAALSAVLVVLSVAAILSRQLSEVPENTIKLLVGIMVTGFGTFWIGEGLGLRWPPADASLLGIVSLVAFISYGAMQMLKRERVNG